jgi:PAS domain S-box-containing protein
LTLRLLLLALLALIPAVAIQGWNGYDLRRARTEEVREQVLRLARLQSAEIDRMAEGARQFLVALAQIPQVKAKDAVGCSSLLTRMAESFPAYRALIAADLDGTVFCSSVGLGRPVADRAYFKRVVQTEDFATGEYVLGRGTNAPVLHFSYPLHDAMGKISGVIAVALDLDWFADRLREKLPNDTALNVADRNGTILVRWPRNEIWRGQQIPEQFRSIIYAEEPGVADVVGLDATNQVLGFVPIPASGNGLYVGVGRERNAAFADLNRTSARGAIVIALGLILSLLLVWIWGEYGIQRPLQDLLALVETWRTGHYASSGRRWDRSELGRLGKAFDELAQTVADRERRLVESEKRLIERERYLSVVLDRVPAGIMQTAPDGMYVFVNRAFCELTGRSFEQLVGCHFDRITHPDDAVANRQLFEKAIETGVPYSIRTRYLRPDGSAVWTELTATPVADRHEGILAVVVELTERMRAEEKQQVLINELNHRVKNTLALVQALAAMTNRFSAAKDAFYKAFSARLAALSQTHNLLTNSAWESATLRDLIGLELEPYAGGESARLIIEGEPVRLKPYYAISLGMVFHELATNAAKYGALSSRVGRVEVSWRIQHTRGKPQLMIEWREIGGQTVARVDKKGFGSKLIEETAQDLRGTADMHFDPCGFRCTLRLPLAELGIEVAPREPEARAG